MAKFKPCDIQKNSFNETKLIFKDGFPEHQAMIYDGKKSICACGLIDIGDGQFYVWTVFGENFKQYHYRYMIRYLNYYLNLLDFRSIHHIIMKNMPWTRKMMSMVGFKYVRDEDENMEHWVRM